ncbi:MAG: CHAT domain-containing tetratricopeptide repeat protein [Gemmataceae bacterium]
MRPLLIVLLSVTIAWSAAPPERISEERQREIEEAQQTFAQAVNAWQANKPQEAAKLLLAALKARERLYPAKWYPDGHTELGESLNAVGFLAYQMQQLSVAEMYWRRSLEMTEKLYPASRHPTGHPNLAASLNSLAALYKAQAEYGKAEPLYRRALEMTEKFYPASHYPSGHPALAQSLNNLGGLYRDQAEYTKAEPLFRRALEMTEKLYPASRYPTGHPDLAFSLSQLAMLYKAQTEHGKAEPLYRRALEMYEKQSSASRNPTGHLVLARIMTHLADLYQTQAEYGKAEQLFRRALEMYQKLYPASRFQTGHSELALNLSHLAMLYQTQAEYGKAEPLFRQALEMNEKLYPASRYPSGHPSLANSLNNLAHVYNAQAEYGKAELLYRQALSMRENLYPASRYPTGHSDLAQSLSNLAMQYQAQEEYEKAEPLLRRALEMREKLYPASRYPGGHPDLALSLNNLAGLFHDQAEYDKAEPLYRRALEIREKQYPASRYPKGHPDLAMSLNNLAGLSQDQAKYSKAESLFRRTLEMYTASAVTMARAADEAIALNYVGKHPMSRDDYLNVTGHLPGFDAYPVVWLTKAALTRVVEQRHLAALAAATPEASQLWEAETHLRRERERLLLAAVDVSKAKARDARLDAIEIELRVLREKLLPLLPELNRTQDQATSSPTVLQKTLPADVAFLDLLRYTRLEQDPNVKGRQGKRRTPQYLAFVITRDKVTRVELGEAKALESTLDLWRLSLMEGAGVEPRYAGAMCQELWQPLAKQLPPQVKKLYISPDAALNRLPWAALLDEKKSRLLEKYTLALVPHGPYLLDHLTRPKTTPTEKPTLLVLGGVSYDEKPAKPTELALRSPASEGVTWKALPGTRKELEQITTLAGDRRIVRREGNTATVANLLADLPKVETAHLATHGFFADARFRSVLQLDPKLFDRVGSQRATAGARSPLVLSGIVCAGANLPDTPNRGIITAEAIVGLDLRKMQLAVLSACETGLGETAGGEGVFGLTRAFHVAGCKNVVASLWKVDDEPTAALMNLFYRQLWQSKEPIGPAEALRRAQLAMLHNPERIPEWAVGRGPLPKAISGSGKVEKVEGKPGHARVWAAFLASGLGE